MYHISTNTADKTATCSEGLDKMAAWTEGGSLEESIETCLRTLTSCHDSMHGAEPSENVNILCLSSVTSYIVTG